MSPGWFEATAQFASAARDSARKVRDRSRSVDAGIARTTECGAGRWVLDVAFRSRARDCQQVVSSDPTRSLASHRGASSCELPQLG